MAYGGSSEFRQIVGDFAGLCVAASALTTSQFGVGGSIWGRFSSDMSTDFAGVVGYFTGAGQAPYNFGDGRSYSGGSSQAVGLRPGDLVFHVPSTVAAIPGRVTVHAVLRSTANFSTANASYISTGGWDCTLSPASTV